MGWLFYVLLLICCFSVRADEAQNEGKLNKLAKSPKNCEDVYSDGKPMSGVYSIYPDGQTEVQVFCEQELQGGGWTVFQRRMDGSVNFYLGWEYYKGGFGCVMDEHWIGNKHLHQLTSNQDTQLLVELQHENNTAYASYDEFWTGDETTNYRLHVAGFSDGKNKPGDSLTTNNGRPFSTYDRDSDTWKDGNCAKLRHGAWWYVTCGPSNLNGLYISKKSNAVTWHTWKGWYTSLSAVRMMLKTK